MAQPVSPDPSVMTEALEPQTPPATSSPTHLPTPLPSGSVYRKHAGDAEEREDLDAVEIFAKPHTDAKIESSAILIPPKTPGKRISAPSSLEATPTASSTSPLLELPTSSPVPPSPGNVIIPEELIRLDSTTIRNLDLESCRSTLEQAIQVLKQVPTTIDKFRSLISQYKLQNQLLTIETHEAAQRYEVENNIVKREVDRLRIDQFEDASVAAADTEVYRRRLRKAKLKLKDAAQEILDREAEIERLKRRLREGRILREAVAQASTQPQQHNVMPQQQDLSSHHHSHTNSHEDSPRKNSHSPQESGLAALGLLASQVLQEQREQEDQRQSPKGLLSPVDLKEQKTDSGGGDDGNQFIEKRRRESSASTITVPSDADSGDEQAIEEGDTEDIRQGRVEIPHSPVRTAVRSPVRTASPVKKAVRTPNSPRSPQSPTKYIRKDHEQSPSRSGKGKVLDFSSSTMGGLGIDP